MFGSIFDSKKTDAPVPDVVEERKKPPGTLLTHEDRLDILIKDASARAPPQLAELLLKARPIITPAVVVLIKVVNVVGPLYVWLFTLIYKFLAALPWDLFQAAMGLGLCFFGGGYCASIAAAEAFYMTCWSSTAQQLQHVYDDAVAMSKAQTKDDEKDEDGDGVADVKQISSSELLDRKIRIAAGAVQDPQRLSAALGGLYVGWLSVQGVLRIQFAKTINLALSCSQFVEYYVCKLLLPPLTPLLGPEFRAWLPVAIKTATKAVFVYFAWSLQEVVSAAQSGLRGGLLFSRGVCAWLNKRGHVSFCGLSLEPDQTYLDEAVGYLLAACGFYVQWHFGFGLPFPFSIVMFPLDIIEWYVRWTITADGTPGQ